MVRGRKHEAAAIRFPWMIMAPSCSGVWVWKMSGLALKSWELRFYELEADPAQASI